MTSTWITEAIGPWLTPKQIGRRKHEQNVSFVGLYFLSHGHLKAAFISHATPKRAALNVRWLFVIQEGIVYRLIGIACKHWCHEESKKLLCLEFNPLQCFQFSRSEKSFCLYQRNPSNVLGGLVAKIIHIQQAKPIKPIIWFGLLKMTICDLVMGPWGSLSWPIAI